MTTTESLTVSLPVGVATAEHEWQPADAGHPPYRIIFGADRTVTNHAVQVSPSAVQWADGSVDDGVVEAPSIYVFNLGDAAPLSSDQARELAAVLLESATMIDTWADAGATRMRALTAASRATRVAYHALATAPGNAGDYLRAALDSITDAIAATA